MGYMLHRNLLNILLLFHNPTTSIVAAIVSEQQYMSNEAILYLAISSDSSFSISNVIVTNDQLPTRPYTLAT